MVFGQISYGYAETNKTISYVRTSLDPNKSTTSEVSDNQQKVLLAIIEEQKHNLEKLDSAYNKQNEEFIVFKAEYQELRNEFARQEKSDELTTFSGWASVLLTSVAVIVTVLGVIIAILSFYGFKTIKEQAAEIARKASEDEIEKKLNEIAVREFKKMIDGGELTPQLMSAVDMIIRSQNENKPSEYPELDEGIVDES